MAAFRSESEGKSYWRIAFIRRMNGPIHLDSDLGT